MVYLTGRSMVNFEVLEVLTEFASSSADEAKRLTLTSWNGDKPKLDLRRWKLYPELRPSKGITLTDADAVLLADALERYLAQKDPTE